MISEGVKVRAQIDSESIRNVMLVNGGGSVALIALLPNVLYTPLVTAVLLTLSIWLVGLTLAVTHSVLRRKCSLIYERNKMSPPSGREVLGINPKQPWLCWWSWSALYTSIFAFLVGGILMVALSFTHIEELSAKPHNKSMQPTPSATAD